MAGAVHSTMPEVKVRFGVGSPTGPRSAIWSLVGQKHDAYIIPIEVKSIAKVSLHLKTGEFSWGYTREYFDQNRAEIIDRSSDYRVVAKPAGRDFERWQRPAAFLPGTTLPLRIYVANEALQTDHELPTDKPIRWIEPKAGYAVGFGFILVDEGIPNDEVVGDIDLEVVERLEFPAYKQSLVLVAHQLESALVSKAAERSLAEFLRVYPDFSFPEKHRFYTQTAPHPLSGCRDFIEIPTVSATGRLTVAFQDVVPIQATDGWIIAQ